MNRNEDCPYIPVSWGELIDKITILQIKHDRFCDGRARGNVACELALLSEFAAGATGDPKLADPIASLRGVNQELWEIEDRIRLCEAAGDFGPEFIGLARSVYRQNDRRAAIKRQINDLCGSRLVEEKCYADWVAAA